MLRKLSSQPFAPPGPHRSRLHCVRAQLSYLHVSICDVRFTVVKRRRCEQSRLVRNQVCLAVKQESPCFSVVHFLQNVFEISVVELKLTCVLLLNVEHGLYEQLEDRTPFGSRILFLLAVLVVSASRSKAVSKADKLLCDQFGKPAARSVVWVNHNLHQRSQLRGTVPAVRAVDQCVAARL